MVCSAGDSPHGCWGVTSPQSVSSSSAMASQRRSSLAATPESAFVGDKLQVSSERFGPVSCLQLPETALSCPLPHSMHAQAVNSLVASPQGAAAPLLALQRPVSAQACNIVSDWKVYVG